MDRHVKSRSVGSAAIYTSLKWEGWLISGNTQCIFLVQNRQIPHGHKHFKTILLLFKSFHHFTDTTKHFFYSYRIFQIIPYPPPHKSRQSYKEEIYMSKFETKNTSHALSAHELMIAKFLHVALA